MHAHERPRPNTIRELAAMRAGFGREIQHCDLGRRNAIAELAAWKSRAAYPHPIALPRRDRVLILDNVPHHIADRIVVRRLDTADDERRNARACWTFEFYRSNPPCTNR